MSNSSVGQALDILIAGQDFTALRRALFATVAGHYLEIESSVAPQSDQENYKVIALNALLARLPTCSLASVTTIAKGKTGIKDAVPGHSRWLSLPKPEVARIILILRVRG